MVGACLVDHYIPNAPKAALRALGMLAENVSGGSLFCSLMVTEPVQSNVIAGIASKEEAEPIPLAIQAEMWWNSFNILSRAANSKAETTCLEDSTAELATFPMNPVLYTPGVISGSLFQITGPAYIYIYIILTRCCIASPHDKLQVLFRVRKILNLRVFDDNSGKRWSKSVMDKDFEVLCVSQVGFFKY